MKPDFRNREFAVVQKGLARKHDTRLAVLAPTPPLPRKIDELAAEARRQFNQHDFSSAKKLCKDVLSRAPSHVDSLNLLGLIAQESGRHSKAIRFFNKAISADPYDGVYHYNIGSSYEALNDWDKAAVHFKEAINLGLDKNNDLGETERLLVQRAEVAACIERMRAAWPRRLSAAELFGEEGVAAVASDFFLCCALETTKLDGLLVEVFLTEVRRALLQVATDAAPDFGETDMSIVRLSFALAQQFFMNEYVYSQSTEEDRQVAALRDVLQEKLRIGTKVAPFLLAIIAAYVPLHTLPNLETLQQTQWPNVLVGLIRQQIIEVKEQARDRSAIPALTAIADTSMLVRRMYEENPYPRWIMIPKYLLPPADGMRPPSYYARMTNGVEPATMLIPGCGTGLHAIKTALTFPNTRILAVDISLASLAYARRKARKANAHNIEFAQADILNLGSIDQRFDAIEAPGVLHHLHDPLAGWRILLSLLRPGGILQVGLYSSIARQGVNAARAFVSEHGYRPTPDSIRACRQEIIRRENLRREVETINDFYSTSDCRDMLFHVMEHQFTIARIKAFIAAERLSFLGFAIKRYILDDFQQQFPGPNALVDLDLWERFEMANPQTFLQTYLFFVRRQAEPEIRG